MREKIAKKAGDILFNYEYRDIGDLLNMFDLLNDNENCPFSLPQFKIGQCIAGIIELKNTLDIIGNDYDYNSLKHKHILLSGILAVDEDKLNRHRIEEYIENGKFIAGHGSIRTAVNRDLAKALLSVHDTNGILDQCII